MTFLLNVFILAGKLNFPRRLLGDYFIYNSLCEGYNAYDDGL